MTSSAIDPGAALLVAAAEEAARSGVKASTVAQKRAMVGLGECAWGVKPAGIFKVIVSSSHVRCLCLIKIWRDVMQATY